MKTPISQNLARSETTNIKIIVASGRVKVRARCLGLEALPIANHGRESWTCKDIERNVTITHTYDGRNKFYSLLNDLV